MYCYDLINRRLALKQWAKGMKTHEMLSQQLVSCMAKLWVRGDETGHILNGKNAFL